MSMRCSLSMLWAPFRTSRSLPSVSIFREPYPVDAGLPAKIVQRLNVYLLELGGVVSGRLPVGPDEVVHLPGAAVYHISRALGCAQGQMAAVDASLPPHVFLEFLERRLHWLETEYLCSGEPYQEVLGHLADVSAHVEHDVGVESRQIPPDVVIQPHALRKKPLPQQMNAQ